MRGNDRNIAVRARHASAILLALTALQVQSSQAQQTPAATPEAPAAAPAQNVSEGPLLERRKQLFDKIQEAKRKGVGIGGYLSAFQALEEQVKAGDGEDKIGPRVDSIQRGLADQLKRSEVLKVQRPLPPQGSQVTGSGPISGPVASAKPSAGPQAGGGGADLSAHNPLIEKLRQRFPGATSLNDIPEEQIPESLRDKFKDPVIRSKLEQKLKEKFGG